MSLEPVLRNNLLLLARTYAEAKNIRLSSVARYTHGDPPFYDKLAKAKPAGFTVRKYDQAIAWFRKNWPEGLEWPSIWEPPIPAQPIEGSRLRRRRK